MKKIYALLLLALGLGTASAQQYYMVSAVNAGFNPGGLNTDIEQTSAFVVPLGWSPILSSSTTAAWSPVQNIPFTFKFAGQTETSFKVSNTGVLTFSTGATAVPSTTNEPLPSTNLPDKSVVLWGLNLSGTNDAVVTKTFGKAPNRQMWIQFNSASAAGLTNGWAYWSIVLEETSNSIYIVDHRSYGGTLAITAGVQVSSSDAYMISASLNTTTTATGALDDVSDNTFYEFGAGPVQPLNDFVALKGTTKPIIQTGSPVYISGDFWHKGMVDAASYDINYRVNGGATLTYSNTNNLTAYKIHNLFHPTQFTPAASGNYDIEMWVSNINNNPDENPYNDTLMFSVTAVDVVPARRVVFEEGTGTWCGWCPRGFVAMDHIKNKYPDAITIAVHNNDPMAVSIYDNGLNLGGYPGSRVDRGAEESVSVNIWENLYTSRQNDIPLAEVKIEDITPAGPGHFTVHMSATFVASMTNANYKWVAVLKEDGVTGSSSGYNQRNYYANNAQGAMGGYESKPDPVPAAQMVYDDVARGIYPDYDGEEGSVTTTITAGKREIHEIVVKVPLGVLDFKKLTAVVMLLDGNTGAVVNADAELLSTPMANAIGLEEGDTPEFNMYPNPANQSVVINAAMDAQYEVFDISGRKVAAGETHEKSVQLNTAEWTNGIYTVKLFSGNQVEVQKLSVLH